MTMKKELSHSSMSYTWRTDDLALASTHATSSYRSPTRPSVFLEDDNHSDAEIQSFPIDYLPEQSALSCSSRLTAGGIISASGHQRILHLRLR